MGSWKNQHSEGHLFRLRNTFGIRHERYAAVALRNLADVRKFLLE
jgi:hypothetical protein